MTVALIGAGSAVLVAILGAVLGHFFKRKPTLDSQRADFEAILAGQRADFDAIVGPLERTVERLVDDQTKADERAEAAEKQADADRTRIGTLERQAETDHRWRAIAAQYIRDLLTWARPHETEINPLPPVPTEISREV